MRINTFFVIPSELTAAVGGVSKAFTEALPKSPATRDTAPTEALGSLAADDATRAAKAAAEAVADAQTPIPANLHLSETRDGPAPRP